MIDAGWQVYGPWVSVGLGLGCLVWLGYAAYTFALVCRVLEAQQQQLRALGQRQAQLEARLSKLEAEAIRGSAHVD